MKIKHKIAVTYDLCDGPGDEHSAIKGGTSCGIGIGVDNRPHEEEARRDLHRCRRKRGTDETLQVEKLLDTGREKL